MHLAYSAIRKSDINLNSPGGDEDKQNTNETLIRFLAYQTACNKYSNEIASIQKYIPGWAPVFR